MSAKHPRIMLALEKLRAAVGAAGLCAVAAELVSHWAGIAPAPVVVVGAALLGAVAAGYVTDVSEREQQLDREARKESMMPHASKS